MHREGQNPGVGVPLTPPPSTVMSMCQMSTITNFFGLSKKTCIGDNNHKTLYLQELGIFMYFNIT
jgi:hypothetical protein